MKLAVVRLLRRMRQGQVVERERGRPWIWKVGDRQVTQATLMALMDAGLVRLSPDACRAVLTTQLPGHQVSGQDLRLDVADAVLRRSVAGAYQDAATAALEGMEIRVRPTNLGPGSYTRLVNDFRRELLRTALAVSGGNITVAGVLVGLKRTNMYAKVRLLKVPRT